MQKQTLYPSSVEMWWWWWLSRWKWWRFSELLYVLLQVILDLSDSLWTVKTISENLKLSLMQTKLSCCFFFFFSVIFFYRDQTLDCLLWNGFKALFFSFFLTFNIIILVVPEVLSYPILCCQHHHTVVKRSL